MTTTPSTKERGCKKSGHCEPVITLLRAKSRLRRLRSVRACGRSGVAIPHKKETFFGQKTRVSRKHREIATPAFGLVRDDPIF